MNLLATSAASLEPVLETLLGISLVCCGPLIVSLLVMQVGGGEIAERSPKAVQRDFRALGRLVEGSGAQVVFSSIPSVAGKNTEGIRKTYLSNKWLRDWCRQWNFGFFDHGEVYMALGLLVTDGVQLSQMGKWILVHELAGLIKRALN